MSEPSHIDVAPGADEFLKDVLEGLRASPKRIPHKYLYDEEGSRLFEEITRLSEYYPTRAEVAILRRHADVIADLIGPACLLVEFGSGNSEKTEILLERLQDPAGYVPVDISRDHLLDAARRLAERHPGLEVLPVVADYTGEVTLPSPAREVRSRALFFPGSTIGNFRPREAGEFLSRMARLVGPGGKLVIGIDLCKDPKVLELAYDDPRGVTAAFNRNILVHANRELGASFRPELFDHRAKWNEDEGRVEMHLVSRLRQSVNIGREVVSLEKGETIWTENSHKYDEDAFRAMAGRAGFDGLRGWTDDRGLFSVQVLRAR